MDTSTLVKQYNFLSFAILKSTASKMLNILITMLTIWCYTNMLFVTFFVLHIKYLVTKTCNS